LQDFAPVFGFASQEAVQGTDLPGLDFLALAAGLGCRALAADDEPTLRAALEEAFAAPGPVLIDARVEDRAERRVD
jgi:benzoylformate decarboxylase